MPEYNDSHLVEYERAGRITASLVGAILRHDPNTSPQKAWRMITGREPDRPVWTDIQRGLDHEGDAIAALEADMGVICQPGRFVSHRFLDWLGASPDAFLFVPGFDKPVPVEVKCPRVVHTEIPLHYYEQVQTQMECMDAPYGYFVSWTEEATYIEVVERDPEWWKETEPILEAWYRAYIEADIEPPRKKRESRGKEKAGRVDRIQLAAGEGADS